jgi:hypothetical protein
MTGTQRHSVDDVIRRTHLSSAALEAFTVPGLVQARHLRKIKESLL